MALVLSSGGDEEQAQTESSDDLHGPHNLLRVLGGKRLAPFAPDRIQHIQQMEPVILA